MDTWVRVMADYSSDGFWARDGAMLEREEIPISAALMERHRVWCEWYEQNLCDKKTFDLDGFCAEGLLIAKLIKAELPAWTVIYFDESKIDRSLTLEQVLSERQPRENLSTKSNDASAEHLYVVCVRSDRLRPVDDPH